MQAHVCKIDGRVQAGMQFGVLVQVVLWDAAGMLFGCCYVLVTARAHVYKIDGRVHGGMQFGMLFRALFGGVSDGAGAFLRD